MKNETKKHRFGVLIVRFAWHVLYVWDKLIHWKYMTIQMRRLAIYVNNTLFVYYLCIEIVNAKDYQDFKVFLAPSLIENQKPFNQFYYHKMLTIPRGEDCTVVYIQFFFAYNPHNIVIHVIIIRCSNPISWYFCRSKIAPPQSWATTKT